MDSIDIILTLLSTVFAITWWYHISKKSTVPDGLPPGPLGWPMVGNLFQIILQRRPFMYIVRDLSKTFGPIFTLRMGQRTLIVITSPELIHEALVQKGPLFASRPPDSPTRLIFSVGKCAINSAVYGPTWRSLRRNFISEIVSPSRVKSFQWIREWAIANHAARLRREHKSAGSVELMSNCRLTISSILICICFGAKMPEEEIKNIEMILKEVMMMTTPKLPDFLPVLTPLFRRQISVAEKLRRRQLDSLLPLVRARRAFIDGVPPDTGSGYEMVSPAGAAYIDSLFGLCPAERGALTEEEIVTLVSEVISAGTDTSATTVEWAMAHLVLEPERQRRLYEEVGRETDVERMEYLEAVVKETLRRHPPSHFVLSHCGLRETELGGYRIPEGASLEVYTAGVVMDPGLWRDPEVWDPERFVEGGEGWEVDLTGGKGVRMVPFGAGRRICPAASVGILHVKMMMAAMVREFEWKAVDGVAPSLEETFAFTVVMKEPLRAEIVERG